MIGTIIGVGEITVMATAMPIMAPTMVMVVDITVTDMAMAVVTVIIMVA
jgi:hypothetical protein